MKLLRQTTQEYSRPTAGSRTIQRSTYVEHLSQCPEQMPSWHTTLRLAGVLPESQQMETLSNVAQVFLAPVCDTGWLYTPPLLGRC